MFSVVSHDATRLALDLHATRRAFGYEYLRKDYAPARLRELWAEQAPWATGSMVPSASNSAEATIRDLAPRMPGHE